MNRNPIRQFTSWLNAARKNGRIVDATAGCLSTSEGGYPDGRMVLLKGHDDKGFVFYTNLRSAKGRTLAHNARAALTFHWAPLEHQVRLQGRTVRVSNKEADAYWKTRPRVTQLGAWASKQSARLKSRDDLLKDVERLSKKFGNRPIPRPPHWTGLRIVPRKIEFWLGRANRLHDRFLYLKTARGWKMTRLYP